nr:hypothetical protein [Pyrobaculum sp.]
MRYIWLFLLAVFSAAQGVILTPSVDYLFLGGQWADVPKFPGDVGLYKLSFYLADKHIDVSIALYGCRGVSAEPLRVPSAGPGVFEAVVKVRAEALGISAGCNVLFKSKYLEKSGSLREGMERIEYVDITVPNYPSPQVAAEGVLYLGVEGRVKLRVFDVYHYNGTVEISAAGAKLYGPWRAAGDLVNLTVEVVVAPMDFNAALVVNVRARDALGREVLVTRQIPLEVRPRPTPIVVKRTEWARAGAYNPVGFYIKYPIPVNGTVYLLDSSARLENGEAEIWATVYVPSGGITIPLVIQLDTGAADRFEVFLPAYPIASPLLKISAEPAVLTAGDANRVSLRIEYPGVFEGQVSVSGGAVLGPTPLTFTASDRAVLNLTIIPNPGLVTFEVVVVSPSGNSERRALTLLATQKTPFEISAEPLEVPAGGREVVRISIRPLVNISEALVTFYPASGAVFPQTSVRIYGAAHIDLPLEVPADVLGNVAVGYRISYTLASGISGEYAGTLYLVATQRPALALEVSITPERLTAGSPFYLNVRLYNSGGVEARDVRLNVSGPVKVVRAPSPIGSVPPQNSRDALFTLIADQPGEQEVRVETTYWDRLGRRYTAEKVVKIFVNESATPATTATATPKEDNAPLVYTVLALIAVGVVIVILGVRRHVKRSS